jgi:hypothetical protein
MHETVSIVSPQKCMIPPTFINVKMTHSPQKKQTRKLARRKNVVIRTHNRDKTTFRYNSALII